MAEEKVEKKENEDAPPAPAPVAADKHDDEQQDIELIKKMLKKYMGDEEPSQEECGVAKEAMEAYKEMGYSEEEAEAAAAHAVKLAKHMSKKGIGEEPEPSAENPEQKEESEDENQEADGGPASLKAESEKKMESLRTENLKLKGELAAFKEAARKGELAEYLDKKMSETKMATSVTKVFKESIKDLKSKEQIDSAWEIYSAGIKAGGAVAKHINFNEAVTPEKTAAVGGKTFNFTGITK